MINGLVSRLLSSMNQFKVIFLLCLSFLAISAFTIPDSVQQNINSYISKAEFDVAKLYIQKNLNSSSQKENISALNYQLVKILFIQSDYQEALQKAFYALDKFDNSKKQIVQYNFIIGCIYSAVKDYSKSIEYLDLVIRDSYDSSLVVKAHLLTSELHVELNDSTKAQESLTAAYQITNQSSLDPKLKEHVSIQYNFFTQNYERCKQQNFKIIQDTFSFLNAKSYAFSMIGDCLIKQDSLVEATHYLERFLDLTFKTKDPEQVQIAAKKLIDVYEQLGIQEKANVYHKIYNEAVNDSLSFSIEKYRGLLDVEEKRAQDRSQSKSNRNKLLLGLCTLLLLSAGIYFSFKKKNLPLTSPLSTDVKEPTKKIVISEVELKKLKQAIEQLVVQQQFLTPKITRKSFCKEHGIKSERYLSHYVNSEFEKSFPIFINDLRIEYAFNRLQTDSVFRNYRIEEIAKASGFGSKKSFERAFLAKYAETPFKVITNLNS